MQVFKDFKDFALKGNVIDLAVWVIIGTAFGKIVSSLVGDVVMPLIGGLLKMVDLTKLTYVIPAITWNPADDVIVAYGKFLQVTFDFVIIAVVVFLVVSLMNRALKKPKKEEKNTPEDIALLMEIRDALTGKVSENALVQAPKKQEKQKIQKKNPRAIK